jgi:hypothetical protein
MIMIPSKEVPLELWESELEAESLLSPRLVLRLVPSSSFIILFLDHV